ncbi:MAG: hypothetical protein SFY67_05975 [Candidatus Melainabacteria bacterium]|nr:hypothetical protein [Candidatus Melainabacteria bacterium]
MSQPHSDQSNCNQDHEHNHAHDAHGDNDHDHVAVDPGEVIAEKSPQDQMLIGVCAIAMTLLMICMGTWMQIPTPTGGGHSEHAENVEHSEAGEHAPAQTPHTTESGAVSVPETHESQSH